MRARKGARGKRDFGVGLVLYVRARAGWRDTHGTINAGGLIVFFMNLGIGLR